MQGDELASWEELALQHGSEAVISLSDSNHRHPILTAHSEPGHLHGNAVAHSSAPPEAASAGAAVNLAPAAVPRAGFLGRMAQQHHGKHAGSQEAPERPA